MIGSSSLRLSPSFLCRGPLLRPLMTEGREELQNGYSVAVKWWGLKVSVPVSHMWLSGAGQIVLTPSFLCPDLISENDLLISLLTLSSHSRLLLLSHRCHILSYICPFEHAVPFNVTYSFSPFPSCFLFGQILLMLALIASFLGDIF